MSLTYEELQNLKQLMKNDRDTFRDYINNQISQSDLSSVPGAGANSRTVGVFMGVSPDIPTAVNFGAEKQVMLAYDTQTEEIGIYGYIGGTAGAKLPLNGLPTLPVTGAFAFNGSLDQLKGWSSGVQGAAGAAVGWTISSSGYQMIQVGQETGLNFELTFGYTYEIHKDYPKIDFDITKQRVLEIFKDNPKLATEVLTDLYLFENGVGGPRDYREFVENYRFTALVDEMCFVAGTMIDLWPEDMNLSKGADGRVDETALQESIVRKPIEEIVEGDRVVSFDKEGNLTPSRVVRLFRNDAKILLDFFGTGVTPGHVYLRAGERSSEQFRNAH